MAFSNIVKVAVAAAGLTLAGFGASAPASAQDFGWGGGHRVETIQYRDGFRDGYRGDGWRRDGWRGRPRCFTERTVRRTPYAPWTTSVGVTSTPPPPAHEARTVVPSAGSGTPRTGEPGAISRPDPAPPPSPSSPSISPRSSPARVASSATRVGAAPRSPT